MEQGDHMSDEIRKVNLEKLKLILYTRIDRAMMEGAWPFVERPEIQIADQDRFWEEAISILIVQRVAGLVRDRVEVIYPANWWEAVKDRFLPAWGKRRWPINYTRRVMIAREYYPDVALPDRNPQIALSLNGMYSLE
jgi:hypothetical protein